MIFDTIENFPIYFPCLDKKVFDALFKTLSSLDENSHEGFTNISGEDIFLKVMTYPARDVSDELVVFESHRTYIDIQATLVGQEGFIVVPRDELKIRDSYSAVKDCIFYEKSYSNTLQLVTRPGEFVLFFPHDAHMPQLRFDNNEGLIKKAVIKVRAELLMEYKI